MDSLRVAGVADDSIRKLVQVAPDAAGGIDPASDDDGFRAPPTPRAPNRRGMNTFAWNMRYPDASTFQGMILWAASTQGPPAPPGTYSIRLTVSGKPIATESFRLLPDPRSKGVTNADYAEQFALLTRIRDRFTETNDAVKTIRYIKRELADRRRRIAADRQATFGTAAMALEQALSQVEDSLYQTRNRSGQDPLNYPIRLNDKLAGVGDSAATGPYAPTSQQIAVRDELVSQINTELAKLKAIWDTDLPAFNKLAAGVPVVK